MSKHQSESSPTAWNAAAAAMAALFLMSGMDGQQRVQAVFLLLAVGFFAVGHFAPLIRLRLDTWLRAHPGARTVLFGGSPFWR